MSDTKGRMITMPVLRKAIESQNEAIIAIVRPIMERLTKLEASHAALEAKALKSGLPWARGTMYAANDVVQHDGSLWKCIEGHVSGATFSHEHFILQVKRGRDGRDAR